MFRAFGFYYHKPPFTWETLENGDMIERDSSGVAIAYLTKAWIAALGAPTINPIDIPATEVALDDDN